MYLKTKPGREKGVKAAFPSFNLLKFFDTGDILCREYIFRSSKKIVEIFATEKIKFLFFANCPSRHSYDTMISKDTLLLSSQCCQEAFSLLHVLPKN